MVEVRGGGVGPARDAEVFHGLVGRRFMVVLHVDTLDIGHAMRQLEGEAAIEARKASGSLLGLEIRPRLE